MTRYNIPAAAAALSAALTLGSCTNDASESIGGSLIQDETQVIVADGFRVEGHTLAGDVDIQGRTVTQLLGLIDAQGYGRLESTFVTQFMPVMSIDTAGVTVADIDSLMLYMAVPLGGYVGDSIAPMGLEVYELQGQLTSPIYSNFDPVAQGLVDVEHPVGSKIYACNTLMATDSVKNLKFREVGVELDRSIGQRLYQAYLDNPETYLSPTAFAKVFPGIYVRNSYGAGRVMKIQSTVMQLYYHKRMVNAAGRDTTVQRAGTYYSVSPEIITNNNIRYRISEELEQRIAEGEQIIAAPAGREVQLTFPIEEVADYYASHAGSLSVLNSLVLKIPAQEIENSYGITPPTSLLMVLSKDKKEFFRKNSLPNNKTSFYATYSATDKSYTFSGLRQYLMDMMAKGALTAEDYTFTLTPVSIQTESSQNYYYGSTTATINAVTPYVETPTMVRLLLDEATVTLTFAKQTVK